MILPLFGGISAGGSVDEALTAGRPFGRGPRGEASRPRRFGPGAGQPGAGLPDGGPRGGRPEGPPPPGARGFLILWLDLEAIRDAVLPELSERYLGAGDDTVSRVQVFARSDQRIVFSRGVAREVSLGGDAGADLFRLLPAEKLGTLELEAGLDGLADADLPGSREGDTGADGIRRRFRDSHVSHRLYRFVSTGDARWRLVASHPAGSLDAAVDRAHRRNLAISFGILLLLGASLMLMLLSTRRIQALARQQLEFVAGVTHELLTPLAAVRSAGQNLADGVVAEPRQVRRYGRLVEDEGRRLSTMVEQVLEFAGMQTGGRSYTLARTALAPVVDGALEEYEGVLEEQGVHLERQVDDDLPEVMADARALRRAIQNLIANAVKYGLPSGSGEAPEEPAWIGLRAVAAKGRKGREVRLSVEDRGPGIAAADLPRLFEPFYRGGNGSSAAVPGSGLGLSLVRHIAEGHGGRVTVRSEAGRGSTFTLHLPAAADGPAEDGSVGALSGSADER